MSIPDSTVNEKYGAQLTVDDPKTRVSFASQAPKEKVDKNTGVLGNRYAFLWMHSPSSIQGLQDSIIFVA